ncbi:MAG: glycosyltransferase family 2 protein [Cyanobacteria bacterium J06632_22]
MDNLSFPVEELDAPPGAPPPTSPQPQSPKNQSENQQLRQISATPCLIKTDISSLTMPLDNILTIIPALNEEATIGTVIQDLQDQGLSHIRVIDNGSQDNTAAIATAAGAQVLHEPTRGYGQACWSGLQNLPDTIDWILFCDADGSDDLSQLLEFLSKRENYDLILGNRRGTVMGRQQLTPVQRFGNWLSGTLIYLGWGQRFEDLGPLRLIRKAALDRLQMCDRNFGWTVEMQVRAIECHLRTLEIPVNYRPRQGGQSKISGTVSGSFKAGTIILTTLAKYYGRNLLPAAPRSQASSGGLQQALLFCSALLLVLGSVYAVPHGDFGQNPATVPQFWRGMAIMGAGFALSWMLRGITRWWFWGVAIATRLILLAMAPGDDIWRYLWEGYLQTQSISPYAFPPNAEILEPLRTNWWPLINHPDVSAIYPPITQHGFRLLASVGLWMPLFKAAFAAADLAICGLLSQRFGYQATLLYAWNPQVIYSFAGGGHYDSWFLLPLVAAWLWFDRRPANTMGEGLGRPHPPLTYLGSALLVGVSIAVKYMSLPVLAFLSWHALWHRRQQWRQGLGVAVATFLTGLLPMLLSALPFCSATACPLIPTSSVFVKYGRSAEFIPYWVAKVWALSRWENWLFAIPLTLVVIWLLLRARHFQRFAEWYLIGLLFLSPIVHGWYFTWLVPFSVASRNWGIRLVSLSAFVYFAMPYRIALGDYSWILMDSERWWLWGPFLLGLLWSSGQATWTLRHTARVAHSRL